MSQLGCYNTICGNNLQLPVVFALYIIIILILYIIIYIIFYNIYIDRYRCIDSERKI